MIHQFRPGKQALSEFTTGLDGPNEHQEGASKSLEGESHQGRILTLDIRWQHALCSVHLRAVCSGINL